MCDALRTLPGAPRIVVLQKPCAIQATAGCLRTASDVPASRFLIDILGSVAPSKPSATVDARRKRVGRI